MTVYWSFPPMLLSTCNAVLLVNIIKINLRIKDALSILYLHRFTNKYRDIDPYSVNWTNKNNQAIWLLVRVTILKGAFIFFYIIHILAVTPLGPLGTLECMFVLLGVGRGGLYFLWDIFLRKVEIPSLKLKEASLWWITILVQRLAISFATNKKPYYFS